MSPTHSSALSRKLRFGQILVFEQVLRSGSILHASQKLNLTQPAVTKIIHELEGHFGGLLLVRSNRGVYPTDLGKIVGRRAKSLLAEMRHMTDEVNAFNEGMAGQVLVGTLISAAADLLPRAIQLLKARASEVVVTLRVAQMDQLLPALSVGDLDLVVARIPTDVRWQVKSPQIEAEALYTDQLCVVGGIRHPLSSVPKISLAQALPFPWILPTRDSSLRQTADRLFFDAGLAAPTNIVESLSVLTNVALMLDNKTIGLMPRSAAQQFADARILTILPLTDLPVFGDIGCFTDAAREPAAAVALFKECLREAAQLCTGAAPPPASS
ncbi:LysR substrate-binding domain-containing protein [Allopusillimonas ginsengisoli]|uniref:LysR substrate-binding domain-containing protein n=1 Tax=Allopusillimonas ginsengisoli TaxID=453575 RepID=UPI00101F5242|nr:LysR substrate-binding domain-containing protein [Allopusillimonas ginsengisoli]TEA78841.1 LysR family transcriptional regulator [Allopusillimonas ginsengisoli]